MQSSGASEFVEPEPVLWIALEELEHLLLTSGDRYFAAVLHPLPNVSTATFIDYLRRTY